jgi:membrane-associated phospholipid phosphatase
LNGLSSSGLLRRYFVPSVALVIALGILVTHSNQAMFLLFNALGPRTGDTLWANWTLFGDALVLLVLSLPFVGQRPALMWALIVTALIAGIVVPLLKSAFGLPRPPAVLASDAIHVIGRAFKSRSFPSGHTTAAFAFAGVLSLYFRGYWVMAVALMIAVGVGISRMAVGVHWPLDVAGGAALGWLCAVAGTYLASRWRWGESLTGQRFIAVLLVLCAVALLFFFRADSPRADLLPKGIAVSFLIAAVPALRRLWRGQV